MKKNVLITTFILLFSGLFFVSCEDDMINEMKPSDSKEKTDIQFNINTVVDLPKNSDANIECGESEAVSAEITIDGLDETFTPELMNVNGENLTQVIKLNSGTYTVTSFKLLDANGNIVKATPEGDSEYAMYVSKTVPFDIEVPEFDKVEESVDVLCFNEADYENFGFNWFNIREVEVHEIPFFGDLCYDPADYEGSIYDQLFNLEDYPFDIPAIFEIRTFVDVDDEWVPLKTFNNISNPNEPVKAEYFTHSDGVEKFKFELWVDVYLGIDGFSFVKFDEFIFNGNDPLIGESNGVVDFVIGDCFYEGTPPQFVYDPIEPILNIPGCPVETIYDNILEMFPENENAIENLPFLFDEENELRVITGTETEVYIEFIGEGAGWVNTFGFYTYELGNEPTSVSELDKTVLWPQVSGDDEGGPLTPGDLMQIASGDIPDNTVVGFYLVAKGFQDGQTVSGTHTIYTDINLNPNDKQQHTLFIDEECGTLVLTFEDILLDNGDKDFNDIIVTIKDNSSDFVNQASSFQLTNIPYNFTSNN